MEWNISSNGAFPVLRIALGPGDKVVAETGSLLLMRGPLQLETSMQGLVRGLLRSFLGGESLFLNTYQAQGAAELWLAPGAPGDLRYLPLEGDAYIVQDGAYLAHWGEVELTVAWKGFKGIIAQGELVWLKASGHGGVWLSAYGAIEEVEVPAGETVTVDNFHFVAMTDGARYRIRTVGGIKSTLLGGEGVVVDVDGPAQLLLQTRQLPSLVSELLPYIPSKRSSP